MSHQDGSTQYLLAYWLLVIAYVLVLTTFLIARRQGYARATYALLGVLVIGPAAAYPVVYFVHSSQTEQDYVLKLAELWGPLWAALSGLWAILAEKSNRQRKS